MATCLSLFVIFGFAALDARTPNHVLRDQWSAKVASDGYIEVLHGGVASTSEQGNIGSLNSEAPPVRKMTAEVDIDGKVKISADTEKELHLAQDEDIGEACQERQFGSLSVHAGLLVVSDLHQAIFVLTPKCGSSTVRQLLGEYSSDKRARTTWWSRLSTKQHAYYKFAFMRDPVSRAISAYGEVLLRGGQGDHQWANRRFNAHGLENAATKVRFMAFLDEIEESKWDNHVDLQIAYHVTETGHPYPLDFIGRLDHFDVDFAEGVRPYLTNVESIPLHAPVCRPSKLTTLINTTETELRSLADDPEVQARIQKIYSKDFALWNQLPLRQH